MSLYAPDAQIIKVIKKFPEIDKFETPYRPDHIILFLNCRVDDTKKKDIEMEVQKCGFDDVEFQVPVLSVVWYGEEGLEISSAEKDELMQALQALDALLSKKEAHYTKTSIGFFVPQQQPLQQTVQD